MTPCLSMKEGADMLHDGVIGKGLGLVKVGHNSKYNIAMRVRQ